MTDSDARHESAICRSCGTELNDNWCPDCEQIMPTKTDPQPWRTDEDDYFVLSEADEAEIEERIEDAKQSAKHARQQLNRHRYTRDKLKKELRERREKPDPINENLGHDIPLCEALGRIEANAGEEFDVVEALCGPKHYPEALDLSEWMEFIEAVHYFVEDHTDRQAIRRCGGCERLFERPQTHDADAEEHDTRRCPYCETKIDNEKTEVGFVAF